MNALARFEGFMQELMDRRVVRLLGGSLQPVELARGIARCMETRQTPSAAGFSVPNRFNVLLNPEDCADLRGVHGGLERKLVEYTVELARERGFNFEAPPEVRLVADPETQRGVVEVQGEVTAPRSGSGQPRFGVRRGYSYAPSATVAGGVWFEVPQNGAAATRLPLERFPFAIGRREGNDLVLPDTRVSRRHAVVEASAGRYRLRDLGSRNGTFLNGNLVGEADLRDGDRLTIGGFEVIVRLEPRGPVAP